MAKELSIGIKVSYDEVASLLCCAMEGGIGYWARVEQYIDPPVSPVLTDYFSDGLWTEYLYKHNQYPLIEEAAVIISEIDDDTIHRLDLAAIQRGLELMAKDFPKHFGDFVAGDSDANTGDTLVQLALFGQIKYG